MLRVPIRYKVAAAMTLPLTMFIAFLAFEVREIENGTNEVHRQTELATATDGPTGLLTSLQDERNWAAVESIGQGDQVALTVEGYDETRRRTDDALAGFREMLGQSEEETRQAFAEAMGGLTEQLGYVRERIDEDPAAHTILNVEFGNGVFDWYSQMIEPFFTGTTELALTIDHRELRHLAELIDTSSRQIEVIANLAREVTTTSLLTDGGIDERQEIIDVSVLLWRAQRNAEQLSLATSGEYADMADDELFVDFTRALTDQVTAATEGDFNLDEMLRLINLPPEKSYNGYENRVADALRAEARALNDRSLQRERLYLMLVALTIVVALVIMFLISRSITRPLRSLTEQAVGIADHGLTRAISTVLQTPVGLDVVVPELDAIAVGSLDEVADVAASITTVQQSAVDLAVGQAVMRRNLADAFVSLGRRNQNLLSRQLDFITVLEQHEADPDVLAQLFELDHLATRMRRNAESLLVLAGNESPRRWAAPVRINDLIRAAVSEVQDYRRVVVRLVEPVTIVGSAATDLAHLLAELIENALQFSRSQESVEVRGLVDMCHDRPDRPDRPGYTLVVVNGGVGMSSSEVAVANRRLAGTESFTVAPSKYLGHYVAGSLAVRHDIRVELRPSVGYGVTAAVQVPAGLLC